MPWKRPVGPVFAYCRGDIADGSVRRCELKSYLVTPDGTNFKILPSSCG